MSNNNTKKFDDIKASDLFVKALENEGVEYVFAIPGEENLDFLESLRHSSIELILTRHEQGAGFMAATYGRLTGKTGVCMSTLGPGATNFVTCAAYAQLGGMPMMMITGQKPIKTSKQAKFQILDVVSMMQPITKFTQQIVDACTIPSLVREAFRLAEEERPGPVHLELPEDVAAEVASEAYLFTNHHTRRPYANTEALDQAADLIAESRHPLILIGAGANRKMVCDSLYHFFEKIEIPYFNTQMGKGAVGYPTTCFIGTAALSSGDYLHCAVEHADLIINIGHDIIEKPPFIMKFGGKKVIHINFSSAAVDNVYFPQLEVVGDIAHSIDEIRERLLKKQLNHDINYFKRIGEEVVKNTNRDNNDPRFPMIPQRIVADVRKAMPEDGIIALDNGMYKIWFARNYRTYQPNTVLLDNALATMGAGLPSALMASLLYPKRNVMAICGDGGFMMNSQEVETAIRLKTNLVVMILNDASYGMIRWKQAHAGFTDFGLTFGNPDFVKYADSYGAEGHRLSKGDNFVDLIKSCFKQGGVHLLDVPVDYSENKKVLLDELDNLACII